MPLYDPNAQPLPAPAAPDQWQDLARESIKFHEGFSASPYLDTVGKRTIGWGHLIRDTDPEAALLPSALISDARASELFEQDFGNALSDAYALVPQFDSLSPELKIALTDMAFNLGRERLSGFSNLLGEVTSGAPDPAAVAQHMQDSKWARQTGRRSKGLVGMVLGGPVPGQ